MNFPNGLTNVTTLLTMPLSGKTGAEEDEHNQQINAQVKDNPGEGNITARTSAMARTTTR